MPLPPSITHLFHAIFDFIKKLGRNRYFRILVNGIVFVFCLVYLIEHFSELTVDLVHLQINGWAISLAWLLTWSVDISGALCWWLLLLGFGQNVDWLKSWSAHLNSAVARYVPGYIWQYVGKAYLTSEIGVPARVINVLMIWELIQLIGTGLAISLIFTPVSLLVDLGLPAWGLLPIKGVGVLLLLLILSFAWTGEKLLSRFFLKGIVLRKLYVLLSALLVAAGWLLHGFGLWLTARAFGISVALLLPYSIYSFSLSLVVGIAVIFVPNGLGVREGIMVYLLSKFMPATTAVLVATVSRLELVSGEFIGVAFAGILLRLRAFFGRKKEVFP